MVQKQKLSELETIPWNFSALVPVEPNNTFMTQPSSTVTTETTGYFGNTLVPWCSLIYPCDLVCFGGCNSEVTQTKPITSWQESTTVRSNCCSKAVFSSRCSNVTNTHTQYYIYTIYIYICGTNAPCTQVTSRNSKSSEALQSYFGSNMLVAK